MACIYALRDPRTGDIRYIGKASDLATRLRTHRKAARRSNTPKNAWLLSLARLGLQPLAAILEEVDTDTWARAEQKWIAWGRALGLPLLNVADGGEGRTGPLSAEARARVAAGLRQSARFAAAMRESGLARRGKPGRPLTEEAKAKIGSANRGRTVSTETRQRMSVAGHGRPKAPEHRSHIARALTGRIASEASRRKMSNARVGWTPPPELIARVKECNAGEGNGRARLTQAQVQEIRTAYVPRIVSLPMLAARYGVSASTIHGIVHGRLWPSTLTSLA